MNQRTESGPFLIPRAPKQLPQQPQSRHEDGSPWLKEVGVRLPPEMSFFDAADFWVGTLIGSAESPFGKLSRITPQTSASYRAYISSLKLFFGSMAIGDITADHLHTYQACRINGTGPFVRKRRPGKNALPAPLPAKPKKVNQEIGLLIRILRAAGLWVGEITEQYLPLINDEPEIPRALTIDEQRRWLETAKSKPRWHLIYWYSVLAFVSAMSTNEIRSLRIGDIQLGSGVLSIPPEGAKNRYRQRTVTLGTPDDEAYKAVVWLLERARSLGSSNDDHYLFPVCIGRKKNFRVKRRADGTIKPGEQSSQYDPTQPMSSSGLKKLWEEVRMESGLLKFRMYDTRHTAITRYAESGVAGATVMRMSGHVTQRMHEHYSHINDASILEAMRHVQARMNGEASVPWINAATAARTEQSNVPAESIEELTRKIADRVKREMVLELAQQKSDVAPQPTPDNRNYRLGFFGGSTTFLPGK